nr:hypothetical protein [Tanacetum cinerariifolium]
MEALLESEGSAGGHWKSKPKRQKSSIEYDLSQLWVSEETDPFTPRICYFDFPKIRMPSHIKTYDGSEDPKDHLKIFQAAAKTKRWAMPTWCHMFNSTLTGKARVWDVKGAPECMKISGSIHGITNPELIKRLHDKIPNSVDEMMRVTTTFVRGGFRNQQRLEQKQDRFTLLMKTLKEILALDKGKFKPPPPMTTPVEKRNASKFYEFHGEVAMGKTKQRQQKRGNPQKEQAADNLDGEDGREGPMIIEAEMGGHFVHRMYVDGGSSLEILYEHCFNRFRLEMNFMVVRSPSPYNTIIRGPGVRRIQAVPSTAHGMLKFPVTGGTVTLRSNMIISTRVHDGFSTRNTAAQEGQKELCGLLRRNLDLFAWTPADMTGVSCHIAEHMLNIHEECLPVRQKKRGQAPERNKAIYEDVEKLVNVDLKDLNKACPKEGYPLPKVDWKVESLCGRALQGPEINYTPIEKLILALSFELEEHDIHYRPRTSVKGKILVDFIVECPEDNPSDTPIEEEEELLDPWVLFTNGSSCIDSSEAGLILKNPEGI